MQFRVVNSLSWSFGAVLALAGCTQPSRTNYAPAEPDDSNSTASSDSGGASSSSAGTQSSNGSSTSGSKVTNNTTSGSDTSSSSSDTGSTGTGGNGAVGTEGSNSSGGGGGHDGSTDEPGPKVVSPCNTDPASVGVWENVTPPGIGRAAAFVINPLDTANLYLGTNGFGVMKSEDCGASWTRIDDGASQVEGDSAAPSWTMAIDFVDPNVIYMNNGYGILGLFKSVDGGVSWKQLLTGDAASVFIFGGFVEHVSMDPTNHLHLTVTPHFTCEAPHDPNCLLESYDGGESWTVVEGTPGIGEAGGQHMINDKLWYWGNPWGAFFRSKDGGKSWTQVLDQGTGFREVLKASDGNWYAPSQFGLIWSTDDGETWAPLANAPTADTMVEGDGKLFTARWGQNSYAWASLDDVTTWTALPSPTPDTEFGAWLIRYDEDHHILYSTNEGNGFWRMVMEVED